MLTPLHRPLLGHKYGYTGEDMGRGYVSNPLVIGRASRAQCLGSGYVTNPLVTGELPEINGLANANGRGGRKIGCRARLIRSD